MEASSNFLILERPKDGCQMIDLLPAVSAVELNVPCRDQSLQTLEPAGQSIKALEVLASRDIGQSFLFTAGVQQSDSSNGRCIKARAMRKVRSEDNDVCPVHSGAHVSKAQSHPSL